MSRDPDRCSRVHIEDDSPLRFSGESYDCHHIPAGHRAWFHRHRRYHDLRADHFPEQGGSRVDVCLHEVKPHIAPPFGPPPGDNTLAIACRSSLAVTSVRTTPFAPHATH